MNFLDLIRADGGELKKAATTNGGEYAGPCPWCGGRDRFRVWPRTDRYWCRACGKAGDVIQYLRDARGLSFREACEAIGHIPEPRSGTPRPAPAIWKPKDREAPSEAWQAQAIEFLDRAIKNLWTPRGKATRRWLHENKGLTETTIKKAMLGYASRDLYTPRPAWGLQDSTNKVWTPAGLVIPLFVDGAVCRLRIRRTADTGPRYVVVSGSSSTPMLLGADKAACVIVESELDAILLGQAAGDLCSVVAMGNAQAKPDVTTHRLLQDTPVILVALDGDEAGARAAWDFWPQTYGPKARRWLCPAGKDPGDAWASGLNVRDWAIAGMFSDEGLFERFCIQTVCGGMADKEAMAEIQQQGRK